MSGLVTVNEPEKVSTVVHLEKPLPQAPSFLCERIALFDAIKAVYDQDIKTRPRETIKVTLPDGKILEAVSWETTPIDIAQSLSKSLAQKTIIAKVDGQLFDLTRPLEHSCSLKFLDFDDDEGKKVFWHSSAHVLGESCEQHYGCHLCIGPPTDEGFFYELGNMGDRTVVQNDYPALEALAKSAITENQPFVRLEMTKDQLLEMFKYNRYKVTLINSKIPDGTKTTVYRCGPLIDLCYGPHIPSTGKIAQLKLLKHSSSYFLGDQKNDSLQRIYGVSFPSAKQMKEYLSFLEEASKRDHRKIGREQELFFFNDLSPGSCFFLPHGARIYNALVDMQKSEYVKRGFEEVVTPNIYNTKLWERSGHWENYKDNMFAFNVEADTFALKPMNCPGHCIMFDNRERSYKELPIRFADFGVLHRNEFSGALSGLTRVRRFQQDDAHIFCRLSQVEAEVEACLDFLRDIYAIFGFTFSLKLSTRPEKYLGEIEKWDEAELYLANALNRFGQEWKMNPGDGAFYGPKIDITISDALRRQHQCATIQLDFQLPDRFNLRYRTDNHDEQFERPVIIHRAILGSVERMIAILTESFAGKWPFWLSPRQVIIIPIAQPFLPYAESIRQKYHQVGLYVEVDDSSEQLKKKIRNAEIAKWNFIIVVGAEEESTQTVNVRNRDDASSKSKGEVKDTDAVLARLLQLKLTRALEQSL